MLLYLVVIFTSIVILLFVGLIAYSKAYKVKNRIIEVIERSETYGSNEVLELTEELKRAGYRSATKDQIRSKCGVQSLSYTKNAGHFYCVYLDNSSSEQGFSYEVVTYVHFDLPVVGDMLVFPVKGETKILGKDYNY